MHQLPGWKILINVMVACAFVLPFFYFGYKYDVSNQRSFFITSSILIMGLAIGWLLGIFLSPTKGQEEKFKNYARAIAAGISGYALAKLDPVFTDLLKPISVFEPVNTLRLLGFTVNVIVGTIIAFIWREHS